EIIEDIPAGYVPKKCVGKGKAARIMTGAMLPTGADKVVKVEDSERISNIEFRISNIEDKSNISQKAEDVKKGQLILKRGTLIRPQEAAMLATVGKTSVKVYRQPKVAVISTGSELVEPSKRPKPGQIRNSNGSMLMLQLKRLGIQAKYLGIARDNFNSTVTLIKKALKDADIVIMSGGVSVGDYDFVEKALKKCGVKILFNKVAIQPGKPTTFGLKGDKAAFGLPGNPVSSQVIFELLVGPFIDKLVGRAVKDKFKRYKLLADYKRRNAKRELYIPVIFKGDGVLPVEYHGSAHMLAMTKAQGIMRIPVGMNHLEKESMVHARLI
ncbi:MAG: molybdopterin molybdotransferase MoeA, partial [Candidatus Margulisiibacteriota bacterium]